jgi:hypothetical protein
MRLKQTTHDFCVCLLLVMSFSAVSSHSTLVATGEISLALPAAAFAYALLVIKDVRNNHTLTHLQQIIKVRSQTVAACVFGTPTAQAVALQQQQQKPMHAD